MHSSLRSLFIFDKLRGALRCGQESFAQTKLESSSRYKTNGSPHNRVAKTSSVPICQGYAMAYQWLLKDAPFLLWRFVPFLTDVGRYEKGKIPRSSISLFVNDEFFLPAKTKLIHVWIQNWQLMKKSNKKVIRKNKGEIICYNIPNNERKYRRIKREEKRTERLHPIDYYDLLHQDCTHRMILLSCARRMW